MFLYPVVFIVGFAVLVLEILGTRFLVPFYGSTIFVWSSLISVTLGSLALGYFLGGKAADKNPSFSFLCWLIFFAGMAVLAIPHISGFVLVKTDFLGMRFGPLVSAAILFSFPLILLGTISPFAVRLSLKMREEAGRTAGNLYSISTWGSLAGGLLAGFYLVPYFDERLIAKGVGLALILIFLLWQIIKISKK